MNGGLTKIALGVLLGAAVTGAGAWLTWASDVVTEAKAIDLIETHSPYLEDRKLLMKGLEDIGEIAEDADAARLELTAIRTLLQVRESER